MEGNSCQSRLFGERLRCCDQISGIANTGVNGKRRVRLFADQCLLSDERFNALALQDFVRRHGDALAPAPDLVERDAMSRFRVFHSYVQFRAGSDPIRPFGRAKDR